MYIPQDPPLVLHVLAVYYMFLSPFNLTQMTLFLSKIPNLGGGVRSGVVSNQRLFSYELCPYTASYSKEAGWGGQTVLKSKLIFNLRI